MVLLITKRCFNPLQEYTVLSRAPLAFYLGIMSRYLLPVRGGISCPAGNALSILLALFRFPNRSGFFLGGLVLLVASYQLLEVICSVRV